MSVESQNFQEISVAQITVKDRVRMLNTARVMQIADSVGDDELINPITVMPAPKGDGYVLVTGAHRLAAYVELGRETIPASIRDFADDDDARLFEVRENLHREVLNALEWSLHLAAEKELYEAKNPETKQGGDRRSDQKDNNDLLKPRRFTAEMADVLGVGEKSVKRAVQIANAIPPGLHAEIHGTPLADNQAQLLKLAALPPEDRAGIVHTMKERGVYKVEKARQLRAGAEEDPVLPLEEAWQRKMKGLWLNGKKAWQRRFLLSINAQFSGPDNERAD